VGNFHITGTGIANLFETSSERPGSGRETFGAGATNLTDTSFIAGTSVNSSATGSGAVVIGANTTHAGAGAGSNVVVGAGISLNGNGSMRNVIMGPSSTLNGAGALDNVFIGALQSGGSTTFSVVIGSGSGVTSGLRATILGSQCGGSAFNDVILIGNAISATASNQIRLGKATHTSIFIGPFDVSNGFAVSGFRQTTTVTLANSVAETTLTGAGVGSLTIPANSLKIGTSIRITAKGTIGDTGTPTFRLRIKLGATAYIDTGAVTFGAFVGRHGWTLNAEITIRTIGAGGTAIGNGIMMVSTVGNPDLDSVNEATSAINTTGALALDVTAQWGTANALNSVICTNLDVEVLG